MKSYKQIFSRTIFIFLQLFLMTICHAQSPNESLVALLNPIHTLTADFGQRLIDKDGTVIQASNGTMALKRPGRFRWTITSPSQQLIIADGAKLWIYDQDLQQVTVSRQTEGMGQTPAMLLSDARENLQRDFNITRVGDWYHLVPIKKQELYQSVDILFKDRKLQQFKFTDNLDQESVIVFTNVKLNPTITDSTFKFDVPRGVDVLSGVH